jgi:hypothetical protein
VIGYPSVSLGDNSIIPLDVSGEKSGKSQVVSIDKSGNSATACIEKMQKKIKSHRHSRKEYPSGLWFYG